MSLNILYLGEAAGTSQHRADALRRLGHFVYQIDPHFFLPRNCLARSITSKLIYELGGWLFEPYVRGRLFSQLSNLPKFDVAWVDSGELFGKVTIEAMHVYASKVLNYNHDDPFGKRDRRRFSLYRQATPHYDLLTVVRKENVKESAEYGASKVLHVFRAADEICHTALLLNEKDRLRWSSQVTFVGTWMPERGSFIARLLELGVPLRIYGGRWDKAKEWPRIRQAWAGPNLEGADYVKAIQCAQVNLGLLSEGNRDLHTTRSAEIPYIGSLLCAKRTSEHETLYRENEEAVFWSTPEECAEKCFWLLENPDICNRIAKAGQRRCIANGTLNEVLTRKIINMAFFQVS